MAKLNASNYSVLLEYNKCVVLVITLFLPPGFSWILARKTSQLDRVEFSLKVVQMQQKALRRWLRAHFTRFDQS